MVCPPSVKVSAFDPRTGKAERAGSFTKTNTQIFAPPSACILSDTSISRGVASSDSGDAERTFEIDEATLLDVQQRADYVLGKGDYVQAEVILRQALESCLRNSRSRGSDLFKLDPLVAKYKSCLEKMGRSPHEAMIQLNVFSKPFGIQFGPDS